MGRCRQAVPETITGESILYSCRQAIFIITVSIQVKAYLCLAKCCENKTSSQSVLQGCIENCMGPVRQADEIINKIQVKIITLGMENLVLSLKAACQGH